MIIITCLVTSFVLWKVLPELWRHRQEKLRWARFREEQARLREETNAKAYAHLERVLQYERDRSV